MQRLKSADKAHTFPATRESGWHATVSGCCASLVGIGLARFAYGRVYFSCTAAHNSTGDGNPDATVPGLMAIGEAVCVSVHSPNRSYRLCSRRQMLPEPPT
jgi:succinate dehydrogenase/fumarate reductase flavoprotein subunit